MRLSSKPNGKRLKLRLASLSLRFKILAPFFALLLLAIGAAEKRPVVRENQIVPRTILTATLSADHRVVDGATAAEFLRTLKQVLEEPGMLLV